LLKTRRSGGIASPSAKDCGKPLSYEVSLQQDGKNGREKDKNQEKSQGHKLNLNTHDLVNEEETDQIHDACAGDQLRRCCSGC
jgi:hypothetical protein